MNRSIIFFNSIGQFNIAGVATRCESLNFGSSISFLCRGITARKQHGYCLSRMIYRGTAAPDRVIPQHIAP